MSTTLFSQNKGEQAIPYQEVKIIDSIAVAQTYHTSTQDTLSPKNIEDSVYTEATTPPIFFQEGLTIFNRYFSTRYRTPNVSSKTKTLELKFEFIVEKDGSISNIRAIEHPGEEFVVEGTQVLQNLPKWKPARINGNPVRYKQVIPITIYNTSYF